MVKFIHTADNHLGSAFVGLTKQKQALAQKAVQASYTAFEQVVEKALAEQVDFVVIAGDLYDDAQQHLLEAHWVHQQFERLWQQQIPVFLTRGNHDYIAYQNPPLPAGVYEFSSEGTTHYLMSANGEQVAISGFSYDTRWIEASCASVLPIRDPHADIHIGIYHGELTHSSSSKQAYAPVAVTDLLQKQYDYWALGHIHQQQIVHKDPLMIYPGNTQGRSFKEQGTKGAYVVEIQPGKQPIYTFFETSQIEWREITVTVALKSSFDDVLAAIEEQLRLLNQPAREYFIRVIIQSSHILEKNWLDFLSAQLQEVHRFSENIWVVTVVHEWQATNVSLTPQLFLQLDETQQTKRMQTLQEMLVQHPLLFKHFSQEFLTEDIQRAVLNRAKQQVERLLMEEETDDY